MRFKRTLILVLGLLTATFGFQYLLADSQVAEATSTLQCLNDESLRDIDQVNGNFPRRRMIREDLSSCATAQPYILLSSYTAGSYLHTPSTAIAVYSLNGPPTGQQSIDINLGNSWGGFACTTRARVYYNGAEVHRFQNYLNDGPAAINTFRLNIPASHFSLASEYGENVYRANDITLLVPSNNPASCKMWLSAVTGQTYLTFTEDPNPYVSNLPGSSNGFTQRYNESQVAGGQPAGGTWNRRVVGPANFGNGAFALIPRTNGSAGYPSSENGVAPAGLSDGHQTVEYSLQFSPDCTLREGQLRTVYLKFYDADNRTGAQVGETVSGQTALPFYTRVYQTDPAGNTTTILPRTEVSDSLPGSNGNDEYGVVAIDIRGGYDYEWVLFNIRVYNGIQMYMPFSEISANDNVSCPHDYDPVLNRNSTTCIPVTPGDTFDIVSRIFNDGADDGPNYRHRIGPYSSDAADTAANTTLAASWTGGGGPAGTNNFPYIDWFNSPGLGEGTFSPWRYVRYRVNPTAVPGTTLYFYAHVDPDPRWSDSDNTTSGAGYDHTQDNELPRYVHCIVIGNPPTVAPTCTVSAASPVQVNTNFQVNAVVNNPNAASLTVTNASLTGGSYTNRGATNDPLTVPAGSNRTLTSGNLTESSTGTNTYTWTVNWTSGGSSGTITCSASVTIEPPPAPAPPSCSASGPSTRLIGENFRIETEVENNDGSQTMTISRVDFTSSGSNGSTTSSLPDTISPGNDEDYESPLISEGTPGTYTYTWAVDWSSIGGSGTITCAVTVTVIAPPVCDAVYARPEVGVGLLGRWTYVGVSNPAGNPAVVDVTDATARISYLPDSAYNFSVPVDSHSTDITAGNTVDYDSRDFAVIMPGDYAIRWDVDWSLAGRSGTLNCNTVQNATGDNPSGWGTPRDSAGNPATPGSTPNLEGIFDFVCSTTSSSVAEITEPFRVAVTMTNNNPVTATVPGTAPVYRFASASISPQSGLAQPTGGNDRVLLSSELPTTFQSGDITSTGLGTFPFTWDDFLLTISGSTGPGGNFSGTVTISCSGSTVRVAEHPYFKVLGNDVSVGGFFGTSQDIDACDAGASIIPNTSADGRVYGYTRGSGTAVRGASVELALKAYGAVDDFYTAHYRGGPYPVGAPEPIRGLAFANSVSADTFGGNFGDRRCIANYWRGAAGASFNSVNNHTINSSSGDLDRDFLQPNSRTYVTIGGSGNIRGRQQIYVNGDVLIDSDINLGTTSWTNRADIPVTYIVAKGDIFIEEGVENIDAILIAIPVDDDPLTAADESGQRGRIYTCRSGSNVSAAQTAYPGYTDCSTKLTINGALVAKEVHFGRVGGTISSSTPFEQPDFAGRTDNIAEIIRFTSEYYLATPPHAPISSDLYRSNSVINLPPVF